MAEILTLLPITVVVAILLFIAKEVVEVVRRHSSDSRKLQAMKLLLARECERNLWAIKSLRGILINVPEPNEKSPQSFVTIEPRINGKSIAKITSHDGGSSGSRQVPDVHKELMAKYLFDVATLDSKLFAVFEPAFDSLAELEHIRESLVHIHETEKEADNPDLFRGFAVYALSEIDRVEQRLGLLYQHCTGKNLEMHRLR